MLRDNIKKIKRDFKTNKSLYALALIGILYYFLFHYLPMYGVIIAFQNYSPAKGILGSTWVGWEHFRAFFTSYYCWRLIRNTLLLNIFGLFWGFPAPIIFALLLNEVGNKYFKKTVQTVSYIPHFISLVVVCGMIIDFTSSGGIINQIMGIFGLSDSTNLLAKSQNFRTIYIATDIWQQIGWNSIIYLAALSGIDMALYEAATIDGCGRFAKIWHITLPSIAPTIVILLILRIGRMMSIGFEKIILLYNPVTYETADVISTFVYRKGLLESNYSYSAAVGLFNTLINLILIISANKISRKINETSLW